jgi:hypothetical protein
MPGASPFDALASADFLVPDRDAAVEMVQRVVGLGAPKPRWSHGGPGAGHRVTFCRANPTLAVSPTLIELIQPESVDPDRSLTEVVPNVAGLTRLQGDRPLKTHGAPVASSDVGALVERARSRGVRHWVQPSNDSYPFERLWMGITADDLSGYRPEADGGLMIEVVPTPTLMLPPESLDAPADAAGAAEPGSMVRTMSRGFLVDDLDRSVEAVADFFEWEPEQGPEQGEGGVRRALLGFRVPRSARIELLAPALDTAEGRFLAQWGPGIWHVRIAVADLAAKAEDLRSRGTRFEEVRTGFADPETVLRIDPTQTPACLFEFASVSRG